MVDKDVVFEIHIEQTGLVSTWRNSVLSWKHIRIPACQRRTIEHCNTSNYQIALFVTCSKCAYTCFKVVLDLVEVLIDEECETTP